MNVLEDKLRTALRETGEEIVPHSVPPLRLRGEGRRPRLRRAAAGRRWSAWLTPLAAAASVAAVVAASLAISATFDGHTHRPPPESAAERAALAKVPAYFVALTGGYPLAARRAVVAATATGSALATVAPPRPYSAFSWVSAASDDRTFVLAAERYWHIAPGNRGMAAERRDNTTPTRFFRLTFDPATHRTRLTGLAVPGRIAATQLAGLALSPDGTKLALDLRQSIEVVNLATGSARTWVWHGSGWIGNFKPFGQPLTWAANNRTLAFQQHSGAGGSNVGVALLDTTTPGGSLRAASKVALNFPGGIAAGAVSGDTLLSPDGTKIIIPTMMQLAAPGLGGAAQRDAAQRRLLREVSGMQRRVIAARRHGKKLSPAFDRHAAKVHKQMESLAQAASRQRTDIAITEFSVATGKPVRVIDQQRYRGPGGWQDVLWVSPSATTLLIDNSVPAAKQGTFTEEIGVATAHTFTPLPQLRPYFDPPSIW